MLYKTADDGKADFEAALNGCLPPFSLHIELLGSSVSCRAVIGENPRCCGQADSDDAALGMARREFCRFLDAQAALNIGTLLCLRETSRSTSHQGGIETPFSSSPLRSEEEKRSVVNLRSPNEKRPR